MKTGIYPGTFDPITYGHMDIIERALKVVDRLIIGVALDTNKTPIFDLKARTQMVEDAVKTLGKDAKRVKAHHFSGLLVNFAKEHKACILIRGLRAVSDFEYEFQMACMNSKMAPEIETIFLTASESTHFVSSRFIKQIARLGGNINDFVPSNVSKALKKHFKN